MHRIKPISGRVGRWWQKVVFATGFYRFKPAGRKGWWQKVAETKTSQTIKSFPFTMYVLPLINVIFVDAAPIVM